MKVDDKNDINYSDDNDLVSQFVEWTSDALLELRQFTDAMSADTVQGSSDVQRLYDLVHNIKGMGTSFDFQLMTVVGASLCNYIKSLGEGEAVNKRILDAHVRAFEVVLSNRIKGDGGPQGSALKARLEAIIQEEA